MRRSRSSPRSAPSRCLQASHNGRTRPWPCRGSKSSTATCTSWSRRIFGSASSPANTARRRRAASRPRTSATCACSIRVTNPTGCRSSCAEKTTTAIRSSMPTTRAAAGAPQVQLEAMDVEGLDAAVMFPSRALTALTDPNMEPGSPHAIARAYNDWLYEFCQADPQRHVRRRNDLRVRHRARGRRDAPCVEELGFKAVFVRANVVNGKPWHDPLLRAVVGSAREAATSRSASTKRPARCRAKPAISSTRTSGCGASTRNRSSKCSAWAASSAAACSRAIPKLKVAFLEANCSWVPWLVWRMDESYELEGDQFMPELDRMPSEYFRRQCIVSVEPDETPVVHVIADFGADSAGVFDRLPARRFALSEGDRKLPRAADLG